MVTIDPSIALLTFCILDNPKRVCWQRVKTQMKCHKMWHFIWVSTARSTVAKKKLKKQSLGTEVHVHFEMSTCDSLEYIMEIPIPIVFIWENLSEYKRDCTVPTVPNSIKPQENPEI